MLLNYQITHKLISEINITPHWCAHCGAMLSVGQKVNSCSECNIRAHFDCSPFLPNHCGLDAATAHLLVAAIEEAEQKK